MRIFENSIPDETGLREAIAGCTSSSKPASWFCSLAMNSAAGSTSLSSKLSPNPSAMLCADWFRSSEPKFEYPEKG